ncbi:MAG: GTPase [Thermoprotei archaeon]|nr:MAG: GTPase [Thermoprotei archaeon]RLF23669.1 MAG: GTPase [Thermoprotei archaeon]
MGAGGRDFHNFNVFFRDNEEYEVVCFTASQIPGIENRRYPRELAGDLYEEGIPIYPEDKLEELIERYNIDLVVLAYSDLSAEEFLEKVSRVLASGANFMILGPRDTSVKSSKPVIAVTAVKTGSGKSSFSRAIAREIKKRGLRVAVIRHPMAYSKDLASIAVQKFEDERDLLKYELTLEEREEYEPYIREKIPVLAGVDYAMILREAERLGDIILWDGGNNDWPFVVADYQFTLVDATRPQFIKSYPGEVNVRRADCIVITKIGEVGVDELERIEDAIRELNRHAKILYADFDVEVDKPDLIKGRKVLVIEDAPTITHGGAKYGAGYKAALRYDAHVIDPRPYAVGIIKKIYEKYKHIGPVLPSLGYCPEHIADLRRTIERASPDALVIASPARLEEYLDIDIEVVRVKYELKIVGGASFEEIVEELITRLLSKQSRHGHG